MHYEIESWLTVVGGIAMYRDAIAYAFQASKPSVGEFASALGAHVTIVFIESSSIDSIDAQPGHHVIAVVPDLDTTTFRRALDQGAAGVIWADSPVSHLVEVTRAALNHDMLLPSQIVRTILSGDLPRPQTIQTDPATTAILTLLAEGETPRQIANTVNFSERTIQRRLTNLCIALGAKTTEQAVHLAHKNGLL